MDDKYYVYFYYNKDDELLYIGKSIDVGARWTGHTELWKKEVANVGVFSCPDRPSMDVLERYFIVKYPTKYNVEGTKHGYTQWEIPGLVEPTIYSRNEFIKKFLPKEDKASTRTIRERLVEMGNTIIEVDSDVNLFDAAYLESDLDRVCFKYQNLYLIPRFASIPAHPHKKKERDISHRTNDEILSIKKYFNEFVTDVELDTESNVACHTIVFPGTPEECDSFLKSLRSFNYLYELYEVKANKAREYLCNLRSCYFSVIQCIELESATSGVTKGTILWSLEREPEMLLPTVNSKEFVFSFSDALNLT